MISFSLRSVFLGHPVVSVGLPSSLEVTVGGCYVNPNHKSNQKSPFSFPSMINPTLISLSISKCFKNPSITLIRIYFGETSYKILVARGDEGLREHKQLLSLERRFHTDSWKLRNYFLANLHAREKQFPVDLYQNMVSEC